MASATYTVDDQDPISFLVPVSSNSNTYYNQILFETGQLPFGQHKLVVTYLGNSTTVPLALNYFVQQDTSSSTSSNATSSLPSGTSSNSSTSSSTAVNREPTEAIIGGIIGGLVLISLLLALFFNRRCYNRRSPSPGDSEVNPFTVPPTSAFLPQNTSIPSHPITSKSTPRSQYSGSDLDLTKTSSGDGNSPLTPLRPQFSSSPIIMISRGANSRFLVHEDSGIRISPALAEDDSESDAVSLPPFYTHL